MSGLAFTAVIQVFVLAADPQDFEQAYARSLQSGRPLVVLIGATWCPPCATMKKATLPAVAQAGGMRHVEYAYVDVNRQPTLSHALSQGTAIPQLIRYDRVAGSWQARYLVGARKPDAVSRFLAPVTLVAKPRESAGSP